MNRVVAATSGILLAATMMSSTAAAQGGGATEVLLFASGACRLGVWSIAVRATSQVSTTDLHVDFYDSAGRRRSDATLVYDVPYRFAFRAPAGSRHDTVEVFVHNGLQELARYRVTRTCT